MKKFISLLCVLAVISCKKDEVTSEEPGLMDTMDEIQNITKAGDAIKGFEKRIEELKKLEPISNDIYKEVFADRLDDLTRTDLSIGATSALGLSSGEAKYKEENSNKSLNLSIFDGAGEYGTAMINMTYLSLAMEMESIQNTTTKKTETFNGIKCLTENNTNPNQIRSTITFLYKERFSVTLEGNNMDLDELKSYMKKLDLSKLD
ncbi:hypothetical protein ACFSX9_14745 [Flavobacterium ardleyense]|uniref:Lipoprotein n=1 Tax=Flavobacterium ardleyense TaxID=2038737 RepID=A0ABW5ZAR8_9FLAO